VASEARQTRLAIRTLWTEAIEHGDQAFFEKGFLDLGVDSTTVDRLAMRYRQADETVRKIRAVRPSPGFQGYDGIGTWFAIKRDQIRKVWEAAVEDIFRDYEFLIEDSHRRRVEVPLFHLNSAPVSQSRTIYEEIVTTQTELSWAITLFGSGMGATQSLEVTYATKLQSENGHPKLLFVPVIVVVYLIGVYERGQRIGRGLRTEMAEMKNERWLPGLRSNPESALVPAASSADLFCENISLSGDTSGNIQTFSRSRQSGAEFDCGVSIEAFNLAVKSKIRIKQKRELKLTYDLPAGHDYEALSVNGQSGIWWCVR
jgi:hypothetical protein